jgi:menaquinone-specific isochorismate synthase
VIGAAVEAAQPGRVVPIDDRDLAAGLANATATDAITVIALPAPIVAPAAIVDAWPDVPLAVWTQGELTIAGVGIARELRGSGEQRWTDVVAQARAMRIVGARPRFVGGAAFWPGAADRAPWRGFGDAWFVLPRWTYVRDGAAASLLLAVDAPAARDAAKWQRELAKFRAAFAATVAQDQPVMIEVHRAPAGAWRTQIESITDAIAKGRCTKVVAARTTSVALASPIRVAGVLAALDDRHPDCVRLVLRPTGGAALVAATPERLVRRDGDVVTCDALAGTTRADHADATSELLASTKDRREHAFVVDAIRAALEGAGASVDAPAEPAVRALRHVLHLHTPFRATLREPRHVLELVARLHPTPAVGGTPTNVALDWIRDHEPVARGWYASPVGWFDLDGNGELAVAIRSGVIDGNRAYLWAGAGIVAGSDPDRELAETELKLRAMLGALGVVR